MTLDRKTLKKPDDFVAAGRAIFDSLAKNSTLIYLVLGALIAAGVVFAIMTSKRSESADRAANAYFEAQQTLEKELKEIAKAEAPAAPAVKPKAAKDAKAGASEPETPEPGIDSVAFKKLDVDSQLAQSVGQLKAVTEKYGSVRAAHEARMLLGTLYLTHGEPEKAISWFEQAAKQASGKFDTTTALNALGRAYEGAGKAKEAAETYEKALKQGEGSMRGELLMSMARSYELAGDSAKARSTYDQIISQLADTEYAQTAEAFKARLQ